MKSKPRIMILHNMITPYRLPLFEELSKKYDLTVYFCKTKDDDRIWKADLENYSFKYKILSHKNFGPFVINPTLKKELNDDDYDFYICFENPENSFSILKALKFARDNNKKFILVNGRRDDEIISIRRLDESKLFIKNIIYKLIRYLYFNHRTYLYKNSDSFISYCNQTTNFLIKNQIQESKIFTGIQNYPESLLSKPIWKSKPCEYKNKKIIFHLGYLSERKGVDYLIKAFNKLNRKDTLLLIAGSGNQEDRLKELAKNNQNIKFLGYREGVEKANYYSSADFFVFPTLYDVWGHVVTESLYYGLPVISTDRAGAIELIEEGKTGFIIPDKNVNALAKTMKRLLDNPKLLKQMRENVKKIPKSKIIDIKTSVKTFDKAINYALNNHDPKK